MKYESNILERLIKTYGVVGNPKYVSEIIKQFIIHGKECYPNLFTYQSDWLSHIDEFGLTNDYVVTYTGQRFYAPNTMDRPVKRAILKGQTLVNVLQNQASFKIYREAVPSYYNCLFDTNGLEANTKYYYKIFNKPTNAKWVITPSDNNVIDYFSYRTESDIEGTVTVNNNVRSKSEFWLKFENGETHSLDELNKIKVLFIKYQDGMENWDIPYFEGMQSVKMPVLTTYNLKRIIDFGNITYTTPPSRKAEVTLSENTVTVMDISNTSWTRADSEKIQLESNEKYTIAYDIEQHSDNTEFGTRILDSTGNAISIGDNKNTYTFTTPSDGIIKVSFYANLTKAINKKVVTYKNINLVKGTTAKPLTESFKSNILTVNEDVTLHCIGDVKDELDCLTGEVVQNIGEIVLDGSENWSYHENLSTDTLAVFSVYNDFGCLEWLGTGSILCDKFPVTQKRATDSNSQEGIYDKDGWVGKNKIPLIINKDRLSSVSVDGLKLWLSNNQLKLQFKLQNKSVKTVDLIIKDHNQQKVERLTSFEGGTHFDVSSQTGTLLPTLEVDVVVDLEETLMTCSTEGNTM